MSLWYLDDGTLAGTPETVHVASSDLGLQINAKKCELYVVKSGTSEDSSVQIEEMKNIAPGIRILSDQDLTLLGAPILEASGNTVLLAKLEDLSRMTQRLEDIDAHDALFLLMDTRESRWLPSLLAAAKRKVISYD